MGSRSSNGSHVAYQDSIMKVLIACEESQAVCKAFRSRGHEAYSCDIQECSGGKPEWHIQGDALKEAYSGKYDLMIAHPPCTYLCCSGIRWLYNKDKSRNEDRWTSMHEALDFVQALMDAPIDKIAIENPISVISSKIRKPDQIIQPHHYGHPHKKSTCLWLKNLPLLVPTKHMDVEYKITSTGKKFSQWYWDTSLLPVAERAKARSKTFEGIAQAMADQWTKGYELQQELL